MLLALKNKKNWTTTDIPYLEHFCDHEFGVESDHVTKLMRSIVKCFVKVRLYKYGNIFICKEMSRQQSNELVLFRVSKFFYVCPLLIQCFLQIKNNEITLEWTVITTRIYFLPILSRLSMLDFYVNMTHYFSWAGNLVLFLSQWTRMFVRSTSSSSSNGSEKVQS